MTKDLSTEEWNKLIESLWVEGGDYEKNISIVYYTLNYDEDRRLEMLDEALRNNLEYLFVGMRDLVYVPRTPRLIRFLERGLEVYPDL